MKQFTFSIKHHGGSTRQVNIMAPDNCPETDFVYRLSDVKNTFSYIGSVGNEGIRCRYHPVFSNTKDVNDKIAYHIKRFGTKDLVLIPLYQHSERSSLYLLEQIAIMDEVWNVLQKRNFTNIVKDSNLFDFEKHFNDYIYNKRFDRKNALRYWLAHPDELNPEKFKIEQMDVRVAV